MFLFLKGLSSSAANQTAQAYGTSGNGERRPTGLGRQVDRLNFSVRETLQLPVSGGL